MKSDLVHDSFIDVGNACSIVYNPLVLSNCRGSVELYIKFPHALNTPQVNTVVIYYDLRCARISDMFISLRVYQSKQNRSARKYGYSYF